MRALRPQGMTLFEVILALALFTMAATALVVTVNAIGQAAIEARSLRTVEQGLEGIMDEYSKAPAIQEMDQELKAGKDGVTYRVVIKPVNDLKNEQGVQLGGMFRIQVSAAWKEDGQPLKMFAETLRYAGMYQPVQ
jgi:prepilin-type N-terminal cleavage/methylation domain-containing protein